jgi:hypothetical protein
MVDEDRSQRKRTENVDTRVAHFRRLCGQRFSSGRNVHLPACLSLKESAGTWDCEAFQSSSCHSGWVTGTVSHVLPGRSVPSLGVAYIPVNPGRTGLVPINFRSSG